MEEWGFWISGWFGVGDGVVYEVGVGGGGGV